MTKLTRRGLLGGVGGLAGLAACTSDQTPEPSEDTRPAFSGTVSFDHGVASGDPLHDKVILWTRITPNDEETSESIPLIGEILMV